MEMTRVSIGVVFVVSACIALLTGCSQQTTDSNSLATDEVSVDGSKYLLRSEPDDVLDVITLREEAKDGDSVVVVGRIGGSENPWIQDRAAFWIVDGSLKACSDIPGDSCEKPWDYCCETHNLPKATALVKVVDDNGDLVQVGARSLLNIKELATVVVTGTAQRDDSGNLTVLATGVFVRS